MNLKNLFSILLLLTSTLTFAQIPTKGTGDGKVSGVLIDSTTKEAVPYATLSVFSTKDMIKPIDGTLTDVNGKFIIKGLENGKYAIKFSSIGYKDKTLKIAEITDRNLHVNLEQIVMSSNAQNLKEVVVTGQSNVVEEKVDRLVFNADKDISSKGSDATEVLRKVPMLTVDLDGNVSLRGNSNIRVLIDNKPSTILASSVADALKQIPADQIKTVEVITSPSAKYDAEGSGGIINIITKKNNLEGYSLNVDLGAGNRGQNIGLNGSLKTGKFGMTLGGFGRFAQNKSKTYFQQYDLDNTSLNNIDRPSIQNGNSKDRMNFGRYSLGLDYDISKNRSLSAGARFGMRSFFRDQDVTQTKYYLPTSTDGMPTAPALATTEYKSNMHNPSTSWDFNLDYLHVIKPQREFSISTLYSRNNANSDFTNTFAEKSIPTIRNANNSLNQEFTLQSDYQTPIRKNQILEFGAKGIARIVDSDYQYFKNDIVDSTRANGKLRYKQNIAATYLAYTYSTANKYIFKVGGRYENTWISIDNNQNTPTKKEDLGKSNYGIFVPSVNISKTFGGKYTVKVAYNKRIQRPGLQQLNPNVSMSNPLSFSQGNPDLKPEITNNYEASLSASIKKVYINLSLFGRHTSDAIYQVTTKYPDQTKYPNAVVSTFQNVGTDVAYGTNLFGNVSITSKWMVNGGVEAFYNIINSKAAGINGLSQDIQNQGWNLNARLMTSMTFKNGWQAQAFGFMRGSRTQPMGRQGGFGFYSMGVRKEFKNKKGSIGFSAQNFLQNYMTMRNYVNKSPTIFQENNNYMYNRGFSLTLSFKIGKMGADVLPKRKAKGVNNDDVKEGGDANGGGAAAQPAAAPARR